jgi:hypothetical protein
MIMKAAIFHMAAERPGKVLHPAIGGISQYHMQKLMDHDYDDEPTPTHRPGFPTFHVKGH